MERLLAWYRVESSFGAVVALLVANAIPLVGVLFFGWNVWTILTIYWLENGVVGIFNVLKMARAAAPEDEGAAAVTMNGKPIAASAKTVLIPFFIAHYGLFWLVHGFFILALPLFLSFGSAVGGSLSGDPVFTFPDPGSVGVIPGPVVGPAAGFASGLTSDPVGILIVIVGLFVSHGLSYRLDYIGRGEYLRTNVARQMFAPYGRLVILHITIIFGAFAIALTGAPEAAIAVLVVLKTALDLALHLAERRRAVTPAMNASG
jgi:cytochrome c oxidase subunit IV